MVMYLCELVLPYVLVAIWMIPLRLYFCNELFFVRKCRLLLTENYIT